MFPLTPNRKTPLGHEWEPMTGKLSSLTYGYFSGCGIFDDGSIKCVGEHGHYRRNDPLPLTNPVKLIGHEFFCGLEREGKVKCWGGDDADWRGFNQQLATLEGVVDIFRASETQACALMSTGLKCWGERSDRMKWVNPDNIEAINTMLKQANIFETYIPSWRK